MSFSLSGILHSADERAALLAGLKRQAQDAAVERAVRTACDAFPATHTLDVTASGHLAADGSGTLSISVRAIAPVATAEADVPRGTLPAAPE